MIYCLDFVNSTAAAAEENVATMQKYFTRTLLLFYHSAYHSPHHLAFKQCIAFC